MEDRPPGSSRPGSSARWWLLAGVALALIGGLLLVGGTAVLSCVGLGGLIVMERQSATEQPVTVTGHTWERTIAIERLQGEPQEGWCSEAPQAAIITSRDERIKDADRRGRHKSTTYAEWCRYKVLAWESVRPATRSGEGTDPAPAWPEVAAQTCETEGCERPGAKRESLRRLLTQQDGKILTCSASAERWRSFVDGDRAVIPVGAYIGAPQCDGLKKL